MDNYEREMYFICMYILLDNFGCITFLLYLACCNIFHVF